MIRGIFLGIGLAIFITSGILITTGYTGVLQENLITGAIIGANDLASYAIATLVISAVIILLVILSLKKRKEYLVGY